MRLHLANGLQLHFAEAVELRIQPLVGGNSATMTLVEVQDLQGKWMRLVLRQPSAKLLLENPKAAEFEYLLLQWLSSKGLMVPSPHSTERAKEKGHTFLLLEYLEGAPHFGPTLQQSSVEQMAAFLVRLHRLRLPPKLKMVLPQGLPSLAGSGSWTPKGKDPALPIRELEQWLKKYWPPPDLNEMVLLHGDYWPGNLLWKNAPEKLYPERQLVGVIDWEDARLGEPLMDLAISRLDLACFFDQQAAQDFTSQYLLQSQIQTQWLPLWDLWAAWRLLRLAREDFGQWAQQFPEMGRSDLTAARLRQRFLAFTHQALNALGRESKSSR